MTISAYLQSAGWAQQQKLQEQVRETPREYLDRESHYLWGKRYLFKVEEKDAAAYLSLNHDKMVLHIRPGASDEQKQDSLAEWYREQLKIAVPPLISKWEPLLGAKVEKTFYQRMKTRWGSCNYRSHHIRLNTELAKKLPECLEYVVVHVDGAPAGSISQQPLCCSDGSVHAEMEVLQRGAESIAAGA